MIRDKAGKKIALKAVRPNLGIAVAYRKKLRALIAEMSDSYEWWLRAQYRENPPAMAMDATAAADLEKELRKLGKRWTKRFDEAAPKLAEWFAKASANRSDAALRKILRDAGFSVKFKMTRAMRDILDATVAENVALIKSIPQEFHTQIQGTVMRSVTAGRDLSILSKDLQKRYGISERRAAVIARNQNNMATASMTRARQTEMGITEAIWLHSHGGKTPRKTHLANSGKRYNIVEGWLDPDPNVNRRIWPGELINCRCVSKPVVRGFS